MVTGGYIQIPGDKLCAGQAWLIHGSPGGTECLGTAYDRSSPTGGFLLLCIFPDKLHGPIIYFL